MKKITGAALAAALLAGCGGGGGALVVPPGHGAQSSGKSVQVAISIKIPSAVGSSSAKRRPAYISASTASAVVDVTPPGGPTTRSIITCSGSVCQGTVPATIGSDTFAIALNDKADGTGNTLSSGRTTATIVEGTANSVSVTFNGVVAALKVAFDKPNPPVHSASTITVHVTALDADGNTIVGPGTYDSPIVVSDGDTSGATSMTTVTLNAPSDPDFTLSYNGTWIGGDCACANITASVPANASVKPATGQVVPIPQVVEYAIPTQNAQPISLAKGADGAIWFTEQYGHSIGRVTTSGAFTEYAVPGPPGGGTYETSMPWAITAGGDGNLWFSDVNLFDEAIDSITTSGVQTRHSIHVQNQNRNVYAMVWGPDGNLWGTDSGNNKIVQFTPAGAETDYAIPSPSSNTQAITTGPDGALWFTEYNGGKIGRLTTAGVITEYATPPQVSSGVSWPLSITSGPDGALWFIDNWTGQVGRATTSGTVTEFPKVYGQSIGGPIITGPDGALWFGGFGGSIGRISTKGTLTFFPIPVLRSRGGQPYKYAIGSDNNLWYVDTYGNVVGKIVF